MTRRSWSGLLALLILALTACGGKMPTATPVGTNATPTDAVGSASPAATFVGGTDRVAAARQFITQLSSGDFAGAEQTFDPTMKRVMPEAKLKDTWQQLEAQVGGFQRQEGTRTEQVTQQGQHYDIVFVTTVFDKATLEARVVFDSQGQIAGLFFAPPATPAAVATAPPASYVNPAAFQEQDVQIHSGDW